MVFPRVIYGSESRTIKKAEHQRIEELMLLNGGVGEDSWESLGLQPVHPKGNQPWIFIGRTDAEAETPTLWPPDERNWLVGKDPDVGKDWRQEEKGTTGWNGRMISLTWWTWVWASSGSWWWTGRPGLLQSMGSQRVGHDWATELNWCITGETVGLGTFVGIFTYKDAMSFIL